MRRRHGRLRSGINRQDLATRAASSEEEGEHSCSLLLRIARSFRLCDGGSVRRPKIRGNKGVRLRFSDDQAPEDALRGCAKWGGRCARGSGGDAKYGARREGRYHTSKDGLDASRPMWKLVSEENEVSVRRLMCLKGIALQIAARGLLLD